jgi:lactoylglutathione lyase
MKNLRHTGIVVSNLEKSLFFYRDCLGLKIVKTAEESGKYIDQILALENVQVTTVKMSVGNGSLIELLYYHSPREYKNTKKGIDEVGISHIAFTVDNVNKQYERLKHLGVSFNSPPVISPDGYAKVVFCQDPDGNYIELVEELE